MNQSKRWITDYLERKAFEDIIRQTFLRYKDNMMCSQDTLEKIISNVTTEIRQQLQGVTKKYLTK
jgi:hypothetical protein